MQRARQVTPPLRHEYHAFVSLRRFRLRFSLAQVVALWA
jgi:hypothetical protein